MGKGKKETKRGWFFIIPAIIIGICAGIFFLNLYSEIDKQLFGLLRYIRPETESSDKIVTVEISNGAISRKQIGRGLMVMREFGAEYAVLPLDLQGGGDPDSFSDEDLYLGGSLMFFGNSYLPIYIRADEEGEIPEDIEVYVKETFTIANLEVKQDLPYLFDTYRIPSVPVLAGARGGGFQYPVVQESADIRQIPLIRRHNDTYYPHVFFAALLAWMGNPSVFLYADRIVLENAVLPGREMKNVLIPLSESGNMYIRQTGPRKVAFSRMLMHEELYYSLVDVLAGMERIGLFEIEPDGKEILSINDTADAVKLSIMNGEVVDENTEIAALRDRFVREAGAFLRGDAQALIKDGLNAGLADEELTDRMRERISRNITAASGYFDKGRQAYKKTVELREELRKVLDGTYCIVYVADKGDQVSMKYGSAVNTIIWEQFIDDFPWWYSLIAAAVLSFLLIFILTRFRPVLAAVIGLPMTVVFAGLPVLSYLFFAVYLPLFFPVAAVGASYVAGVIVQLAVLVRRKRDIYIKFRNSIPSSDMKQLSQLYGPKPEAASGVKRPVSVLAVHLVGAGKIMSEKQPEEILQIFKHYSQVVRETVLAHNGIVGNLDFDSAWCVWGAFPDELPSAQIACRTGLAVIQHFIDEKQDYEVALGIGTGEVVRGNSVDLNDNNIPIAGIPIIQTNRLVSANDLYGTHIVVTEKVKNEVGNEYLFRRLDRVRIEGVNEIMQVYELVGKTDQVTPEMKEFLEAFERGHALFDKQDWVHAHKAFIKAVKIMDKDKAAKLFARRCQKFVKEPPSASWDGSFTISGA